MPEAFPTTSTPAEKAADRGLITNCVLSLTAALLQVVVGFTVAHWITVTADKQTGWIVSGCCLLVVLFTGSRSLRSVLALQQEDDAIPGDGRRLFLAKLALSLSVFALIVVIASSLILFTLRPND